MNSLEGPFRAIVAGPHQGLLVRKQRIDLAKWLVKTATVLNVSQNYRYLVPDNIRHKLGRAPDIPAGFEVYLAKIRVSPGDGQFDWQQGLQSISFVSTKHTSSELAEANMRLGCAIRVNELVGTVYFSPNPVDLRPSVGMTRAWPRPDQGVTWETIPLIDSLHECLIVAVRAKQRSLFE
jgi:hypothetical protein